MKIHIVPQESHVPPFCSNNLMKRGKQLRYHCFSDSTDCQDEIIGANVLNRTYHLDESLDQSADIEYDIKAETPLMRRSGPEYTTIPAEDSILYADPFHFDWPFW